MTTFEEDRMEEKKVESILDYFKLLYVEKLTYRCSTDTFKMLNGEYLFRKLLKNDKEGIISLDKTNTELVEELKNGMESVLTNTISINGILKKELDQLRWLPEIISEVVPDDTARESIVNFSSFGTYNDVINSKSNNFYVGEQTMYENIGEIQLLIKKRKNS